MMKNVYNIEKNCYEDREQSKYFLIEKHKCANGYLYYINERFAWDYDFILDNVISYKLLYKCDKID
jgi:hypothetical protein